MQILFIQRGDKGGINQVGQLMIQVIGGGLNLFDFVGMMSQMGKIVD